MDFDTIKTNLEQYINKTFRLIWIICPCSLLKRSQLCTFGIENHIKGKLYLKKFLRKLISFIATIECMEWLILCRETDTWHMAWTGAHTWRHAFIQGGGERVLKIHITVL